jgi:hypothetical protein
MSNLVDIVHIDLLHKELQHLERTKRDCLLKVEEIDPLWHSKRAQLAHLVNEASPISSLPNEILAMIFEARYSSSAYELPFEILVTHITRRFRNIAISNPQLWNRIRITLNGNPAEKEVLSIYLSRSAALPLDLRVNMLDAIALRSRLYIASMCQILTVHASRWIRLSVVCHSRGVLCNVLEHLCPISVPLLKHLHIALMCEFDTGGVPADRSKAFSLGAPALRHVRVSTINLCSLISLQIHAHPTRFCEDVSGMLVAISAPLLQQLVMENVSDMKLAGFIASCRQPKYPSLRSVTIGLAKDNDLNLELLALSRAFPTTTHLSIDYQRVDFLDFLYPTVPGNNTTGHNIDQFWPSLHTLDLSSRDEQNETVPMLGRMVLGRIAAGYPIQRIRLSQFIMRLEALQGEIQWLRGRLQVEQGRIPYKTWDDNDSWTIDEDINVVCAHELIPLLNSHVLLSA